WRAGTSTRANLPDNTEWGCPPLERKMAVHIRLARHGTKKAPYYRIVVTDSRNPRDGRFVEKLGAYNPVVNPKTFELERTRYEYWTSKGATPSATLVKLLKKYPALEKPGKESVAT